jgi:competence ComEA-like helix-hairpin-helix protein
MFGVIFFRLAKTCRWLHNHKRKARGQAMPPEKSVQSDAAPRLLRRADQAAVAGLCLFALLALAGYWLAHGGMTGRLIEIDRVDPLTVQFRVDVNTADWPELVTLPDVGELMARRIVEYRQQHGPFQAVDDLRRIRGIGPKTMEHLRPYLEPIPATTVAGK